MGAAALEGGTVAVDGDVRAYLVGAAANKDGSVTNLVTIDGSILTSGDYVKVGGIPKTVADSTDETGTYLGYKIFTATDAGTYTARVNTPVYNMTSSDYYTSLTQAMAPRLRLLNARSKKRRQLRE